MDPAFVTVAEAAIILGVSKRAVYLAYQRGELMGKRIGRYVRLSRASLMACEQR